MPHCWLFLLVVGLREGQGMAKQTVQVNFRMKPEVKSLIDRYCEGLHAKGIFVEKAIKAYIKQLEQQP